MRKPAAITLAALAAIGLLALAVPPLIDWSGTRDQIAGRLSAATGRTVRIDGKLSLRLLPAPALTANGLTIGNPEGMAGELARVEQVRLKLAVLPLLTGKLHLKSVELDRPLLTLAHAADGRPNWRFAPENAKEARTEPGQRKAATPAQSPTPAAAEDDSLPVGAVTIHDGAVQWGGLRLDGVNADVMLGGRLGPFQGKGHARLGASPIAIEAAVDRLESGRGSPASLNLRLPDEDAALEITGLVSQLSGGETLRGRLNLRAGDTTRTLARLGHPANLPAGALSLTGELTVSADEASLNALELAWGEVRASGALSAALGGVPQLDLRLTADTVNLDKLAPRPAAPAPAATAAPTTTPAPSTAAPPPPAPATPTAAQPASGFSLPRDLFASLALGADTLVWHGQEVRQAKLDAVLDGGELMLRQAAACLPGSTEASADGALTAENGQAVFEGTVRLKSDNAATFLAWTGAGFGDGTKRLELTAPLRLTWPDIRLNDFRLAVDGAPARGNAALRLGDQPGLALTAALNGMDVMVKGRLGNGQRIEDGAFRLTSSQGLRPLRAFGITPPAALERLGALNVEGNASGTKDVFDITGLSMRVGRNSVRGLVHADLRGAKPQLNADLDADTLALDGLGAPERSGQLLPGGGPLLPPSLAPQPMAVVPAGMVGAGGSPFSRDAIDLSGLNAVDAKLSLKARSVTNKGWRLDDAVLNAVVQDGTATIDRLTGRLLGGTLSATAKLGGGATPAASGQFTITGADLGAAKLAAAGLTVTEGRMDAEARFTTSGRSSQDMAARLDGDGKLLVRNGVLDGFDLPAVNRQMGNLRNLGSLLGVVQAGLSGGRTPFSQLTGTFRADKGMVVSRDLKLEAEGGGASADTAVNLPEWSTRTAIAFHLAAAPQVPVGIRLEGPLENPRKVVDLNAIQQHMVVQGLGRALGGGNQSAGGQPAEGQPREKNTGKNILKNLLKGLGEQ